MLSLDLPPWFFNVANKLLRGFFWSAKAQAERGKCIVAWETVCSPKDVGGLGIKNLQLLNHALRMRWRWLSFTEDSKPWQGLAFDIAPAAEEMFRTCTTLTLGNGRRLKFWRDRWLGGRSVEQIAPNLLSFVRPSTAQLTVADALQDDFWVSGIHGALSVQAIVEFFELWDQTRSITLQNVDDTITWRGSANGAYCSKSAYQAFFQGKPKLTVAKLLWKAGAPLRYKLHMWFTIKDRLWTADRLERRGLDHPPECTLCCQEPETAEHITIQCSYAREIWYTILLKCRLHRFTPTASASIITWWTQICNAIPKRQKKEINALILLVARCLWLERNSRVFDKFATMPVEVCRKIWVEFDLWKKANLCGSIGEIE
jgi:hypothetical protein